MYLPYEIVERILIRAASLPYQSALNLSQLLHVLPRSESDNDDGHKLARAVIRCLPQFSLLDAARRGHVSAFTILLAPGAPRVPYSEGVLDFVSGNGHVAVLEWWRMSGLALRYSAAALLHASAAGHVRVLQWWRDSGLPVRYGAKPMKAASRNGHIHVLDWWLNLRALDWWLASGLELRYSLPDVLVHSQRWDQHSVVQWWADSGLAGAHGG
ncbi:hypothetical protein H9P43_004840 [Blastocladiella emersonii ATCC 22665]|nr:hypothetical protein H9P43_004840 [Blastocladiella emersonii ATCC 22665]